MKQIPKNQRKNGELQGENKLTVIIAFAKRCNEPHYINKKDEAETQTPQKMEYFKRERWSKTN